MRNMIISPLRTADRFAVFAIAQPLEEKRVDVIADEADGRVAQNGVDTAGVHSCEAE